MKIKYRFFKAAIFAIMLIAFVLPLATLAMGDRRLPRFVDDVGLLSSSQAAELTSKLDEISQRHQFDTVVAVVHSLDHREARLFAVDFFEDNGFGFGWNSDGCILLLATRDRDYGFASLGFGLTAFTPAGQEYLQKLYVPHLREDDYFEAFMAFADAVDDFLTQAKAGTPYDNGNIPMTPSELASARRSAAVFSLVAALTIAFIITQSWKSKLKTVRGEHLAHVYIRQGSMALTANSDVFLHSHVSRTRRAANDDKKSNSGGSFTSSSGSKSTGHSGKY